MWSQILAKTVFCLSKNLKHLNYSQKSIKIHQILEKFYCSRYSEQNM